MRRHTLVRSAVATVTAIGIAAGIAPLTTGAAFAADAPSELVIPADQRTDPNATVLNAAGESGYLSGWTKTGFHWTTYADGVTKPVTMPKGMNTAWGTGTDTLVLTGGRDTGAVIQRNMKDGSERTIPLPAGQLFAGAFGDVVVTDGSLGLSLMYWEDGKVQEKRVRTAGSAAALHYGNKDGILVQESVSGMTMLSWLGRDGVVRSTHLKAEQFDTGRIEVSGDRLVQWTKDGKATVWKTSDFWQADQYLTLPGYGDDVLLGAVGDNVLVARRIDDSAKLYSSLNYRVVARPFKGGPERVVLDRATAMPQFKQDGTMVIGAVVDGHQGVYAVGSSLDATKIVDAPSVRSTTTRISLAQGRLNTVDLVPGEDGPEARLRGIDLSLSGPLTAGPRTDRGLDPKEFPADGAPDLQASGDGRLVYRGPDGGVRVIDEGAKLPARKLGVDAVGLSASGHYVATALDGIKVTDFDTGKQVYNGPAASGFALSGSTLWSTGEPAVADALDVRTGKRVDRAVVGDCAAPALQAQGASLYWQCGPGKSGVYDTVTKKSVDLPAHQGALLGDGYVAWQKDGVLSVTDVRGTTGTHVVGKPADARPGRGWTVDPFGGAVAYVDAAGDTHVVPSGVDTSKATRKVLDEDIPATLNAKSGAAKFRWWLPRPAGNWFLVLRKDGRGGVVRQVEGDVARGPISAEWDGRDSKGRLATNGRYTWELYSASADLNSPLVLAKSSFTLTGATPAPRDFIGDDAYGDLLAFTPSGVADFRGGKDGKVDAKVSGSGWTGANTVTAAVPFDDIDGDGSNDVLVRLANGELRAYKPSGKALTPSTPYTKIGGGWNIFDSLTSTGDFTGDGRADLIAREASTGDLYLYEANGSGNFKGRVKIGTGWKGYTLTGAGDLNGDRATDLLARDASGVLWLYPGTGKGELAPRTKVGGGWQTYDSLVGAGDLNGDGRPDLLARDTTGVLWSYAGDGKGNFAGRQRIGGGWQMYKYIA
ncbi:FG-GAP-like repeat-containing protein [Streptomyces sp. NPDC020719]|uniref:FG-GAP-like repeat-containing protein n=1 Tax=Streptomyces sp. NPDC020719 TaxID=3154896 RepID=UPI0033DB77B7